MPIKKNKRGPKPAVETRLSRWIWKEMARRGPRYKRVNLARDLGIKRLNRITELLDEGRLATDNEVGKLAIWADVSSIFIYGLIDRKPPEWYDEEIEKLNRIARRLTESNRRKLLKEARELYEAQPKENSDEDNV